MKNLKKSIIFFIFISLLLILMEVINLSLPYDQHINELISQSFVTICILFYLVYVNKFKDLHINSNNFNKGFILGIYILFIAILNVLSSIDVISNINFNFSVLLLLILGNFMVAFFEEIVCRGIIFNNFLKNNTPLKAGALSSFIFGLAHILNLSHNPDLMGVLNQVIYTFFLGMLFAAIYYKTKSLLVTILLHFTLDLTSGFDEFNPVSKTINESITNIYDMFISTLISLPCFIIGYFLLRKKV